MKRSIVLTMLAVALLVSGCETMAKQMRSTTEPALVKAVLTSGLNDDGSPIDERTVFTPYEKIYLSIYVKNAKANRTVIKMWLREPVSEVSKYLTAKKDGDQYIGIDTGITDPFEIPALKDGKTYIRMKLDQTLQFSFVTPTNGVILIDDLPIVIAK